MTYHEIKQASEAKLRKRLEVLSQSGDQKDKAEWFMIIRELAHRVGALI